MACLDFPCGRAPERLLLKPEAPTKGALLDRNSTSCLNAFIKQGAQKVEQGGRFSDLLMNFK